MNSLYNLAKQSSFVAGERVSELWRLRLPSASESQSNFCCYLWAYMTLGQPSQGHDYIDNRRLKHTFSFRFFFRAYLFTSWLKLICLSIWVKSKSGHTEL